jgi:putative ABC transport system permease protein
VSATGAGLLGFGYAGDSAPLLLGGVCAAFAGITMLTPAVARPAAGLIGWLFAWSAPGRLGRAGGHRPGRGRRRHRRAAGLRRDGDRRSRQYTLAAIYTDTDLLNGWLLPASAAAGFRSAQPTQGFVRLGPTADVTAAKRQVAALLADSPEVGVSDRAEYTDQQNAKADRLLRIVQLLLAFAVVIAVLGIVNTVALSVLDRTRELGLLRAVGLSRARTMFMTATEATVISIFGALLGVLVGAGLGAATIRALQSQGVTDLIVPVDQMGLYLGLAVITGVLASLPPAARAARLNVLHAIAHD